MDWLLEKSSRCSYKTSSKKDRDKTSYKEPASQCKIDHKKCTTTQSIRPQDKAPEKAQSTTSPICRLLLRTEGTIQHGLLPLQRDAMSPQKILLCRRCHVQSAAESRPLGSSLGNRIQKSAPLPLVHDSAKGPGR